MQLQHNDVEIQEVKLQPLDEATALALENRSSQTDPWIRTHKWYLIFVVLPTLLAAVYYFALAADRYETQAQFVVRSPSTSAASQISNLIQGSGIVRSAEDAYVVHAFVKSRDGLRALRKSIDIEKLIRMNGLDFMWSYPPPWSTRSEEVLWRHFQHFIDIHFDSTTGISTLKVRAFRPDDARQIATVLLTQSEALINALSERSRREALHHAEKEVELTRKRALEALRKMTEFRSNYEMIDPTIVSQSGLQTISQLTLSIANTRADLAELRKLSPRSPQARALEQRIHAYEQQVQAERRRLAGADSSLAPLIERYERLKLEREFAEQAFRSAQVALNSARLVAERQRLFLEQISTPTVPDYPKYPSRLVGLLIFFVILHVLHAILRKFILNIWAHADN